jgi:hypothetical protein
MNMVAQLLNISPINVVKFRLKSKLLAVCIKKILKEKIDELTLKYL